MKGSDTMKKLMSIIVSILFALSLTGLCFAQATAPEKKAEELKVEQKKDASEKKDEQKKDSCKKKAKQKKAAAEKKAAEEKKAE